MNPSVVRIYQLPLPTRPTYQYNIRENVILSEPLTFLSVAPLRIQLSSIICILLL